MFSRTKHLAAFFKDSDKKKGFQILFEMCHYGWDKKELSTDYFKKFLYRKNIKNYLDFLSMTEYYKIIESKK